jgi:hypothetical protein
MALQIEAETNRGLSYKIRMIRVLIDGQMYIFCYSQYAVANSSTTEWILKKKINLITYHALWKALVMKKINMLRFNKW